MGSALQQKFLDMGQFTEGKKTHLYNVKKNNVKKKSQKFSKWLKPLEIKGMVKVYYQSWMQECTLESVSGH